MKNKKLYIIFGLAILLVGIAAFVGARMLNPNEGQVTITRDDIIPAPELPITQPEITGMFVEWKDNTIIVSVISFDTGIVGLSGDTPKVEIIVTNETIIYGETTDFTLRSPGENFTVQQTVEESTLDDLNSQTMFTVWGRRSGDRVIAVILFYSNPLMLNK